MNVFILFYALTYMIFQFDDKKKPDRYKIIGSIVAVVGAAVIFIRRAEAFLFQHV